MLAGAGSADEVAVIGAASGVWLTGSANIFSIRASSSSSICRVFEPRESLNFDIGDTSWGRYDAGLEPVANRLHAHSSNSPDAAGGLL